MSKTNRRTFSVRIPGKSILNEALLEELDLLFDLAPPHMLRRSISGIFWAYLCNTRHEDLKPEIKEIATDFNCLLRFLEAAEKYEKEKETKKTKMKWYDGL